MSTPLVSIVVPTYNQADFLREAIESVRAQTLADWEMIVVNNRSTDDTVDVVASFNDPRIRLLEIQNDGIIAASRNLALSAARCETVAFLDSDDQWYSQKLERCLSSLNDVDVVCHSEFWTRGGRPFKKVHYGPERRATFQSLLYEGNSVSTSAVVARIHLIRDVGGFSEDRSLVTAEDYDLWLSLAKAGARFRFLQDVLGEYRVHEASASSSTLRNANAILSVIERHHRAIDDGSAASARRFRKRKAIYYHGVARQLQAHGDRKASWSWIRRAVATDPFLLRTYAGAIVSLLPRHLSPSR
jgi:glycosyltransferase involved in cell wall biosynthesis